MHLSVQTHKCPNCGGSLALDPVTQKLTCQMCQSLFDVHDVDDATESGARISVYSCPSCGAALATDETTAATACYYCHNPVVLSGRLTDELRPDSVTPFAIDRQTAQKKFEQWTRKKRFVPKPFFEQRAQGMTGVYYPYWQGDFDYEASFDGQATRVSRVTTRTHIVVTTQHFHVLREGAITFRRVMRNALKKADRTLADGVMPYPAEEAEPFHAGYLTGFTAEARDMQIADIEPDIKQELNGYIKPLLTEGATFNTLTGATRCRVKSARYRYTLLPAWVFTYKGEKGKIYTYSINGQTGKVCGRLPISVGRLAAACAGLGALVCAIMMAGGYFLW